MQKSLLKTEITNTIMKLDTELDYVSRNCRLTLEEPWKARRIYMLSIVMTKHTLKK
jgi:hypothetical protein